MRPKLLLRIAALLLLLHLIGHTVGSLTWDEAPNARMTGVILGMKAEHFDFQGRSVTLGEFFNGYGFSMAFVLLFLTLYLWLQSSRPVRNLLVLSALLLLALGICEWVWFFPLPAALSLMAAICTGWAGIQVQDKIVS